MSYATINPYTGQTVATFPDATDAQVAEALEQAHTTFQAWRQTTFEQRRAVLTKAAQLLRADKDALAAILTLEMGKITAEALAEVELSAKIFEFYAEKAEGLLAPEPITVKEKSTGEAIVVKEPLGVLFAVEPWNFPYYQLARIAAP
ncbi:MAG: aldehyde dehydrogenase family protein, partial [Propioniciclava sp.]